MQASTEPGKDHQVGWVQVTDKKQIVAFDQRAKPTRIARLRKAISAYHAKALGRWACANRRGNRRRLGGNDNTRAVGCRPDHRVGIVPRWVPEFPIVAVLSEPSFNLLYQVATQSFASLDEDLISRHT
jgi:hypothetical protein